MECLSIPNMSTFHPHILPARMHTSNFNSLITCTDSPVWLTGALTKQLPVLPVSETCVARLSDTDIEHTRVPQQHGRQKEVNTRRPTRLAGSACSTKHTPHVFHDECRCGTVCCFVCWFVGCGDKLESMEASAVRLMMAW